MIHTVREILPELVTQLMSLLSGEETEQQEVQTVHLFLVVPTNNTLRPVSAPRVNCAGSLGNGFWARSSKYFEPNHHRQMPKPERESACF
jgi:hypothetical protein